MRQKAPSFKPPGKSLSSEIEMVTVKTRDAAIELLVRFFREEGFATPRSRIAENFDRMLADPFCWCAVATDGEVAQAVIAVSTVPGPLALAVAPVRNPDGERWTVGPYYSSSLGNSEIGARPRSLTI